MKASVNAVPVTTEKVRTSSGEQPPPMHEKNAGGGANGGSGGAGRGANGGGGGEDSGGGGFGDGGGGGGSDGVGGGERLERASTHVIKIARGIEMQYRSWTERQPRRHQGLSAPWLPCITWP